MDSIERAADMFFGDDARGRTLNVKFGQPANGRKMTAMEMAEALVRGEEAVRSGRAEIVHDID